MKNRLSKTGIAMGMSVLMIANTLAYGQDDDNTGLRVSVSDTEVEPGALAVVAVNLDENPGVYGILLKISYDQDELELISYEDVGYETIFSGQSVIESETKDENPYVLLYEKFLEPEGEQQTGILGYLTFQTKEDFMGELAVDIAVEEARSYDLELIEPVEEAAGTITVQIVEPEPEPEETEPEETEPEETEPEETKPEETEPEETKPEESVDSDAVTDEGSINDATTGEENGDGEEEQPEETEPEESGDGDASTGEGSINDAATDEGSINDATDEGSINDAATDEENGSGEEEQRLPGDVNDDGVVDAKDVIFIKRYNANWNIVIAEQNADVNGDGTIDGKDMIMIRRYVVGWNIELQ